MDKPSQWAVKQARDMLQGPFNAANAEDDAPLHAAVAAALTAAHEAGREEMSKAIEDLMTRYLGVPAEFGWEARFVQAAIEVKRAHEAGRKVGLLLLASELEEDARTYYTRAGMEARWSEVSRVRVRARWLADHPSELAALITLKGLDGSEAAGEVRGG